MITEIKAELGTAGMAIGPNDTAIAGRFIAAGTILVTNNTREFARVPGLVLEDWKIQPLSQSLPRASSGPCKSHGELVNNGNVSEEFNKTFSHFLITVAFIKRVRSYSSFTT